MAKQKAVKRKAAGGRGGISEAHTSPATIVDLSPDVLGHTLGLTGYGTCICLSSICALSIACIACILQSSLAICTNAARITMICWTAGSPHDTHRCAGIGTACWRPAVRSGSTAC